MLVCKAARQGAKEWLRTLPRLVEVSGGHVGNITGSTRSSEVWRLNLEELQWERMPDLRRGRACHACCAVREGILSSC
jgi:hypothetical protein